MLLFCTTCRPLVFSSFFSISKYNNYTALRFQLITPLKSVIMGSLEEGALQTAHDCFFELASIEFNRTWEDYPLGLKLGCLLMKSNEQLTNNLHA